MRVHPLDLAIVIAYLLGVTLLGLRFRQQQHTASDYFLGGRSAPWWALALSIVATRGDRTRLILRREGPQPKFDLAAIAKEIARTQREAEPPRLLFDWSQVTAWPFEAPTATAIRFWYSLAPRVSRAALIHDGNLDRHAAMLSAVMRALAAEVKSFPPGYDERALAWLDAAREPATGVRAPRRPPAAE